MKELSLKELQQECLNILIDVHSFCNKNSISYSIAYGTLIGAVRHKGFIPWDDDIDIMMLRGDFEQFCKIYKSKHYSLIYYGNDKSALAGFARVVDCKKTYYEAERPWTKQNSGVWIDIFPIDYVEDDMESYAKRYRCLQRLCKTIYKFRRVNHHISKNDNIWSITKTILARFVSIDGLLPYLLLIYMIKQQKISQERTKYLGQCSCLDDGPIQFPQNDFNNYTLLNFEGQQFYAIRGYDHHLRQLYGDYMNLPPIEKRYPKQYWIKFYWKNI